MPPSKQQEQTSARQSKHRQTHTHIPRKGGHCRQIAPCLHGTSIEPQLLHSVTWSCHCDPTPTCRAVMLCRTRLYCWRILYRLQAVWMLTAAFCRRSARVCVRASSPRTYACKKQQGWTQLRHPCFSLLGQTKASTPIIFNASNSCACFAYHVKQRSSMVHGLTCMRTTDTRACW